MSFSLHPGQGIRNLREARGEDSFLGRHRKGEEGERE